AITAYPSPSPTRVDGITVSRPSDHAALCTSCQPSRSVRPGSHMPSVVTTTAAWPSPLVGDQPTIRSFLSSLGRAHDGGRRLRPNIGLPLACGPHLHAPRGLLPQRARMLFLRNQLAKELVVLLLVGD